MFMTACAVNVTKNINKGEYFMNSNYDTKALLALLELSEKDKKEGRVYTREELLKEIK